MISVAEALQLIQTNTTQSIIVKRSLMNAAGYALAQDILSPISFPSFRQSAVDGYAYNYDEFQVEAQVQTSIQAGDITHYGLDSNKVARIFTGAKVPDNSTAVVMQELVTVLPNGKIAFQKKSQNQGANIRAIGSQSKQGELLLTAGTTLSPASLSLLASVGVSEVHVMEKPRVLILHTGNELVKPGKQIEPGQVYESNSYSLQAALKPFDLPEIKTVWVNDTLESTTESIQLGLLHADVILITGGVSVGDYDFVLPAAKANVVEEIFHTVKQRPGKPLYFGKKENKLIFGLPGNPASVLTSFYLFVYPCLRQIMGHTQTTLPTFLTSLKSEIHKKKGLTFFMKGVLSQDGVDVLDHQESYKMNSFAMANVLIELEEEREIYDAQEKVKVYLLPF